MTNWTLIHHTLNNTGKSRMLDEEKRRDSGISTRDTKRRKRKRERGRMTHIERNGAVMITRLAMVTTKDLATAFTLKGQKVYEQDKSITQEGGTKGRRLGKRASRHHLSTLFGPGQAKTNTKHIPNCLQSDREQ